MDKKFLFRIGIDLSITLIWSMMLFYEELTQQGRNNLTVELLVLFFVYIVVHRGILASLNRGIYNSKRMFVSFVYVTLFSFLVIIMITTPAVLNLPMPGYVNMDAATKKVMLDTYERAMHVGYTFWLMYLALNFVMFKTLYKIVKKDYVLDISKKISKK